MVAEVWQGCCTHSRSLQQSPPRRAPLAPQFPSISGPWGSHPCPEGCPWGCLWCSHCHHEAPVPQLQWLMEYLGSLTGKSAKMRTMMETCSSSSPVLSSSCVSSSSSWSHCQCALASGALSWTTCLGENYPTCQSNIRENSPLVLLIISFGDQTCFPTERAAQGWGALHGETCAHAWGQGEGSWPSEAGSSCLFGWVLLEKIQKGRGEARIESVREVDTCFCDLAPWLQFSYLICGSPPLKPDTLAMKSQRRSPKRRTVHTSCRSSCSVHGPLRVSSLTVTISTLWYDENCLTLLTPTLYRLGAGLLALLSLCACWLQFQDYLDEIQSVWMEEERKKKKLVQRRVRHFVLVAYWFGGFCLSFIGKRGGGLGGQVMWWVWFGAP